MILVTGINGEMGHGLIQSLNTSLNIDFISLNPFEKVANSKKIDNFSSYAISMGLALRGTLKDEKVSKTNQSNFNFEDSFVIKGFNTVKNWLLDERKK